jgi:hypothetical protein
MRDDGERAPSGNFFGSAHSESGQDSRDPKTDKPVSMQAGS